ncbi:MAG: hypothetical protein AAB567_00495 [Patescibacteria group bacterium]
MIKILKKIVSILAAIILVHALLLLLENKDLLNVNGETLILEGLVFGVIFGILVGRWWAGFIALFLFGWIFVYDPVFRFLIQRPHHDVAGNPYYISQFTVFLFLVFLSFLISSFIAGYIWQHRKRFAIRKRPVDRQS